MVKAHRPKSPDSLHSTEDLIPGAGHVHRSPSARERFLKQPSSSNGSGSSSTSSRRSNGSYAARLIKFTASRPANQPASADALHSEAETYPVGIQRTLEVGALNPDPSTWFTGARISSSSSGAVGPGSLNVLGGRNSADSASGLWRRSVSEGRTSYAR